MPPAKNYYKILQVDPSAEAEVIAAAYKRLSIKYHPDTNRSPDANRRMQEINEAFDVLKDPARRRQYDLNRRPSAHNETQYTHEEPAQYQDNYPEGDFSDLQPSGPLIQSLSKLIVSLTFPVTYILSIFVLFRLFRPGNIIMIAGVLIVAGIIAYYAAAQVERGLRKRK